MRIVRPSSAELRSAWPREDSDFTPWLAENLDFLDVIGLGGLECLETEVPVPGSARRLDILAATADGRRVAIENQYRTIDHDHFTRGLAYAVGLNARALVIIAEEHRDEFVALADYINRCAEALGPDDGIPVFLVTVRVETVGDFIVPRFDVRSEPNTWRSEILTGGTEKGISDATLARNAEYRQFWADLLVVATSGEIEPWSSLQPRSGNHLSAQALSGVNVTWNIAVRANESYAMLWIDFGDTARNSAVLQSLREVADVSGLDFSLDWKLKETARSCSVNSEMVQGCGYSSDPEQRRALMPVVLERSQQMMAALDPHLARLAEATRS